MVIPFLPAHRPVSHCCMATASMGEPAVLKAALRGGQPVGTGAKCSGTTIRSFQEQPPVAAKNVLNASAVPDSPKPWSPLWSAQLLGWPPCPGTITREQGWFWSQPSEEFSSDVSIRMLSCPVAVADPVAEVIA